MKKRGFVLALALMICLFTAISAYAEGNIPTDRQKPLFVDDAHLLSEETEAAELNELLEKISSEQACEVAIVTVNSLDGKSAEAYADDYYDYNGYGYGEGDDGILLLISMQSRDWAISTYGKAIWAFTDWAQSEMMESYVLPFLSRGDYDSAFLGFAHACESILTAYEEGDDAAYSMAEEEAAVSHRPQFFSAQRLWGALFIGVVAAFITVSIMKGKMKSLRAQAGASDYVVENSLNLTRSVDLFLYSQINRVKREQPQNHSGSSTHMSSSGRSHGGSHGKF